MNYFMQFFSNIMIITAAVSWAVAQLIKTIIEVIVNKKFNPEKLVASGGMPSSHSSFVTALSFMVGFTEGFDSTQFSICFVLSMIVMYDAAGVRRATGNQAKVINLVINELEKNGTKIDKHLKEILGHTPVEVFAGGALGIIIAMFVHNFVI